MQRETVSTGAQQARCPTVFAGEHLISCTSARDGVLLRKLYQAAFFMREQRPAYRVDGSVGRWALDLRLPLSRSEFLRPIVMRYLSAMKARRVHQVAGRGIGAHALVGGIAACGRGVAGLFVRDGRKQYGFRALVEGLPYAGGATMVVDDILSSGRTLEATVLALREEGVEVRHAMTVFEFGWRSGRQRLERLDVEVMTLATLRYRESGGPAVSWAPGALEKWRDMQPR